jgi:hypothetical protein
MTTHDEVVHDPLVGEHCGILAEVTAMVGDAQVRHRGTIGGALAHGDAASDLPAALLALDGSLVVQGAGGRREIAAAELFLDYLTTSIGEDEVVVEVRVPKLDASWGWHYEKFTRVAQAWAIVGSCALVRRSNGTIDEARVGLTNMATVPLRATATEQALAGAGADAIDDALRRRPRRAPTRQPTSTPTVLPAAPRPGADAPGAGGRSLLKAGGRLPAGVDRPGEPLVPARGGGLPRRHRPRHGRVPDPGAAAAAVPRGGRGGRQDGDGAGAGRRARRARDPAAVLRGHRRRPRPSTTGTSPGRSSTCGPRRPPGRAPEVDADELEAELYDRRFLVARPILQALETTPCVLLIDEIDRADDEFEALLLEVLSEFRLSIPELGTITTDDPPVVVLTSNRTREVHDALKRRCYYHWVDHPGFDREVAIVRARMPGVGERLAREVVAAVQALREQDLLKPPGVAETFDWTEALVALGADHLDAERATATLGSVLKFREDQERARHLDVGGLVARAVVGA